MRGIGSVLAVVSVLGAFSGTEPAAAAPYKEPVVLVLSDGTRTLVRNDNKEALFGGYPKSGEEVVFHGLTWSLTYQDAGTGQGFDHPTLGVARRDVLKRVLEYVSSVLNEPGGRCDINVDSTSENSNTLATAGPLVSGFFGGAVNNGLPFSHITTGIDARPDLPADMQVTVNFSHNYNLSTSPPAQNQSDLESVLLHEITHGLGFLHSLAFLEEPGDACHIPPPPGQTPRPNGTGWFGEQPDNYARYDTLLRTGNGNLFINELFFFVGENTYFTGGDNGVRFAGPETIAAFGSMPTIFAPGSYQCGSSMSHWNFGVNGVMEPGIADGTQRRVYADFEIAALRDLGYSNAAFFDGGGEGEGEGEGQAQDFCQLVQVSFTSPGAAVQAQANTNTASVALRSEVTVQIQGGCTEGTVAVTYSVNGSDVGTSQNMALGFPENTTLAPGNYTLRATAELLESGQTIFTEQPLVVTPSPTPPVLEVSPLSGAFGSVEVGSTAQRSFVVENTGGGTLTGSATVNPGAFSIVGSGSYSLAGGASQTITVRFQPGDSGSFNATLTFTGEGGPVTVPLTGSGVKTGLFNCGPGGGGAGLSAGDALVVGLLFLGLAWHLRRRQGFALRA